MKRVVLLMFAAMSICAVAADNLSEGKKNYRYRQYRTALPYLQAAAKEGYGEACYLLGRMYRYGLGTEKNYEVARRMFERGMEYGYTYGEAQLGEMYEYGLGVQKDMAKAVGYYRRSAGRGLADGQYMMAMCYWEGKGVEQRRDSAFALVQLAMDTVWQLTYREEKCHYILGECYEYGYGTEVDIKKAIEHYTYHNWNNDDIVYDPECIYRAAILARYNGFSGYGDYINLAIRLGHSSPEILYRRYLWWCGGELKDKDCLYYLEKAVEAGYGPALREMAEHYEEGSGVPVNYAKAKEYAARADKWFATHAAEYEEQQRTETDAAFRNSQGMYHVGDSLTRNDTLYRVMAVSSRFEPVKLYNLTAAAEMVASCFAGYLKKYSSRRMELRDYERSYVTEDVWFDKNNEPYVVLERDDEGNPSVLAVPTVFKMSHDIYVNGGYKRVLSYDEVKQCSKNVDSYLKRVLAKYGKEWDESDWVITSEYKKEGDRVTETNLNPTVDRFSGKNSKSIYKGKSYAVLVKYTMDDLRRAGLAD